jgi:hypothetical protein
VVDGAMKAIGPKGIQLLIDNDKYIIGCIMSSYMKKSKYPTNMNKEEIQKLEQSSQGMMKWVVMGLTMVRDIAGKFPEEMVRSKITPEWLVWRGKQKYPEIIEQIALNGIKGARWLSNQSEEICLFCLGRLIWSDEADGLVEVKQ